MLLLYICAYTEFFVPKILYKIYKFLQILKINVAVTRIETYKMGKVTIVRPKLFCKEKQTWLHRELRASNVAKTMPLANK